MKNVSAVLLVFTSALATLSGQQTYLNKEYIRAGARTIAIENYVSLVYTSTPDVTQSNPWNVVASADFDGNGVPDLVWQDPASGTIQVWFMTGANGTQLLSAANIAATSWKVVAAADFNGDGNPDLLLQNPTVGAVQI